MVAVLEPLVANLTGRPNDALVIFVSTLGVSTAFWALRSRAVRLVDRLFYRTRVDPALLLAEMSEQLSSAIRLDEVTGLLTRTLPEQIGAHRASLMVLSDDRSRLERVDGDDFSLPMQDVLNVWADHGGEPILQAAPPPWVPAEALQLMEQRGVELLFPLQVGDQMLGLWNPGVRRSGLSYTSQEMRTLNTLARQAAIALQNARLVGWLESHSYYLEEEIRRRTQDLERERNRLNVILQNMIDGLLATDSDGRVLLVNPAFEEMIRYPARVLLGQPLDQAFECPDLSALIARAQAQEGQVRTANLFLDQQVLKVSALALRDQAGVITVLRDITRETEIDRMKTEFISNVSHELRTPLTAVLGFAKLIARTFQKDIVPKIGDGDRRGQRAARRINENLAIIVSEGERLTRLINDVLDIAKMEAGRVEWHDRPFDLWALVREALDGVKGLAQEQGLSLEAEFVPDSAQAWPPLVADADRIRQVLINLISNAIKFTSQGKVSVSARLLSAGEEVAGWRVPAESAGGALLAVADTGVGISEDRLPFLFQRFQQLTDALPDTDKPRGAGLGLPICREIVNHYHGAIWAESELGVGSTFYFVLPL